MLENSGEEKVVFEASLLAHSLILRGGFGSWLEAVDYPPPTPVVPPSMDLSRPVPGPV